jgi:hypothetical protein
MGVLEILGEGSRIVSLWDIMQRFRAASFVTAISEMSRSWAGVHLANAYGCGDAAKDRQLVGAGLKNAAQSLAELPLSTVLRSQFDRLQKAADNADGAELMILLREYHNNLVVELSSAWFLMIPENRRENYEQRQPAFGKEVSEAFLEAHADIAAASRCLALDESTACVFHLMRVLEHGLRALSTKVGLAPETMAHENWKNVIDQIEKKIREVEALPKSASKIQNLQSLSTAATQFRYFKDAWRNHVSHSRATYDMPTAETVWFHVRGFMQQMAGEVSSGAKPS